MKRLCAAIMIAAAPLVVQAQEAPVKIGFITTLTTPAAAIGNDMVDGLKLAIEHVGGKIANRPIEVVFEDDGLRPEVGRQKAVKLVGQDKVDVVAGFIWSNVLLAARKPVLDAGKLLISTNAGPSDLAGKLCAPNFFSMRGQNDMVPMSLGEVMNQRGVKKLYILAPNYAAGTDMAAGVERTFKGEVVGRDFTKWGDDPQLDFSAELANAAASGADALFAFYPGRAAAFARQYQQSGLASKLKLYSIYTLDQIALPRLQEANVDSILGSQTVDFWSPDIDTPENKRFVQDFKAKYGRTPSNYAAGAYDLIPYLKAAIEQAGGDVSKTDAVREALIKADYKSVRGSYKLDKNHFPIDRYRSLQVVAEGASWNLRYNGFQTEGIRDPYVEACTNER
jgi:branched-chain amino acid transport system substrate-binding protein